MSEKIEKTESPEKTLDEILNELSFIYLLIRERRMGMVAIDPDYNFNQSIILEVINRGVCSTMTEVSRFLALNTGGTVYNLKILQDNGLIEPLPQQGQKKPLRISEKGKEALKKLRNDQGRGASTGRVILAGLSDAEKISLRKILEKILNNKDLLVSDEIGTNGAFY